MKYPIGIQNFESLRQDGYVYVDKTDLVYKLVNEGRYFFLSRPRRFGKSLLLSTIEAYLSGKRELFSGLKLEQLESEWIAYPIIHIDLNIGKYDSEDSLFHVLDDYLSKLEAVYGTFPSEATPELRFKGLIERIARKEGQRVVILVDEYDKPMLQALENPQLQERFRRTLKAFYSVLKTNDQYIKFAFLTGVTKFAKVSIFSDLNNLSDISMDDRYQTLCGITEQEIGTYFGEGVSAIARNYRISVEQAREQLKKNYDGYHFTENGVGIYNPFSLLNTLNRSKFGSYWFETGTPTFLVSLFKRDNFPLPDLTNGEVTSDTINSVDSFNISPLPILYQSGYLTIKNYDARFRLYTLGFPNGEVEEGFINYLLPFYTGVKKDEGQMFIGNLVQSLEKGRPNEFMQSVEALFADTDYRVVGDSELYFQNVFYLFAKLLGFYTEVERTTSRGRIDMVLQTKDYVYIFEFKLDQSADIALRQIEEKGYAKPFAADKRKLYRIGVNFSLSKRCIDDWKVEE